MNNNIRLSNLTQWVAWQLYERPNGKPGKKPINPHTGQPADKTNPAHWGTLLQARERAKRDNLDGIGICLTTADPFLCIDLDDAIDATGVASALAVELMGAFNTYTECSPSGKGLHIWLKSDEQINKNMKQTAGIEIYSHASFLTWTGKPYPFTPNQINVGSIAWVVEKYGKPKSNINQANHRNYSRELPIDDSVLWEKIFKYDQTQRLRRLYNGDLTVAGGDHSQAVLIALNSLARFTNGDRQRMRRMIEQTSLPNDKWTTRRGDGDWLDWRIADACAYMRV